MVAPGLLALDLDGTLLREDNRLPLAHERAVRRVQALGIPVAIVTGRPLLTTRWIWQHLALPTPVVCFNGVWVGHPDQGTIAERLLAEADVRSIIAECRHPEAMVCAYPSPDRWLVDRLLPRCRDWPQLYGCPIDVMPAAFRDWRGPSCKIMVVGEPTFIPELALYLKQCFRNRFHVVVSQADRLEIIPLGSTKAWGLERLSEHLGVAQAAIWACGDAANDSEMLAWAGTGCAMGHAPEAVRQAARHVLPSIEDEGLAAVVPLLEAALAGHD